MKKLISLILMLSLVITVVGVNSASAMYDASHNKGTTYQYYTDVETHKTCKVPEETTTRTVNIDGTMTIKNAYNINDEDGNILSLEDGIKLSGAYFTVNNIKCENSDELCKNSDGLFFSDGPVTVNYYTGPSNYSNHRTITKYGGYGIDNGRLMYEKYEDITLLVNDDPAEAGVGCAPETKTYTLTEPGLYRISQATCSIDICFTTVYYDYVCILDGTENLDDNVAKTATATPHYSKINTNGKLYNCPAYIINGNNYIRLRDIAYMLNGTNKQFNVTYCDGHVDIWDRETNNANGYEVLGTEFSKLKTGNKTATLSTQPISAESCMISINPLAYIIDGSNYMRLVDLARIIDFGVSYNASTGTVSINTSVGYSK